MDGIWNLLIQAGLNTASIDQIKHLYLVVFMISVVVTIIGIARYVIGLKSLRVYIPIVITFAFYEIGYRVGDSNQLTFFRGLVYGLIFDRSFFLYSVTSDFNVPFSL